MRRLIIFRHAKAVPHHAAPDFDRALNERGFGDAAASGRYMAEEHLLPDVALVSPSLRTRQTWEQAAKALGDTPVKQDPRIYEAEAEDLLAVVRDTDPKVRTAAIVGHNPGMAEFARRLVGHGDRYAFSRMRAGFPTSAMAVVDFPVDDWREVDFGQGRLDRFVAPGSAGD
ncbi:phosphoglycerate mutase [Alsobacter soli]|uniref:Phosphoglycerate mutase n=1 Tax=Alsobacter soli TaxID=2109933 RepID=A0A2T1HU72_9HYPH|nr:histidine phosphatase family protein [Alsobacter soli]PSC05207.1 phosphoglycerate mutase [Alsobacter soli]